MKQIEELGVKVALAAYEAGPTGLGLARALESSGMAAAVVAPSRVMRPVSAGAKTDRLGCLRLAGLGMRGMLKPIAVPSKEEEAIRSLNRRSHELIKERERVWEKLKEVVEGKEQHRDVENLCTTPGVGPVTARTFRLELFRPVRFNRAEEVTSYLGLAPMVRHSGEGKPKAHIRPVGQRRLRSHLVEECWIWKRYDLYAKEFYNRILSRCGSAQKAIVALARKLAKIIWGICMEKRAYRLGSVSA